MKTGSLLGVAILAAFITYCLCQRATRLLPALARLPEQEPLPDRDGEIAPAMASPETRTPGAAPAPYPPYQEPDPSVRH